MRIILSEGAKRTLAVLDGEIKAKSEGKSETWSKIASVAIEYALERISKTDREELVRRLIPLKAKGKAVANRLIELIESGDETLLEDIEKRLKKHMILSEKPTPEIAKK